MLAPVIHRNDDWVDLFCGAGGATSGLVLSGHRVRLAANHWQTAIDTHAANHPETDHACVDINHYDMRRLPRTRFLWASVICTEASPAGGRRKTRGQLALDLDGTGEGEPVAAEAFERTRACALDVIRASEVHRYDAVVVENVVEFHTDWELFDWWRQGMDLLGYHSKVFSMSAAHVGGDDNEPAPQWRDRIIILFVRKGLPMPDLTPTPAAWCPSCGVDVEAVQSWKNGRTIGKYRSQYVYRCPRIECRHAVVEPYIVPAATVIDWDNPGPRIEDRPLREFFADRKKIRSLGYHHLAPATLRKISLALAEMGHLDLRGEPLLVTTTHGKTSGPRAVPARLAPLPTRTVKTGDGIVIPPGTDPRAVIVELRGGGSTWRPPAHPLGTLSTSRNHGLVVPYRRGTAKPTSDPLLTLATRDSAGVVLNPPAAAMVEVLKANYRMLTPREAALGQRFPYEYVMHGTRGEQTMQAGNAVPVNLSQWVGARIMQALGTAA